MVRYGTLGCQQERSGPADLEQGIFEARNVLLEGGRVTGPTTETFDQYLAALQQGIARGMA